MFVKNNIIHRSDMSSEFEDTNSLGHLIIKNLSEAGDKTMLVNGVTGEKLSAVDLVTRSIDVAKALTAIGIKKGDVVSIVSENSFEYAFIMFGTIFNNSILAPINNTYSAREINHAFNLSKPQIVFAGSAVSENVIKVARSLKFIHKVILLDNENSSDDFTMKMKEFMSLNVEIDVHFEPVAVDTKKTVCFIMLSSGTTGAPKGVQISQQGLIITTRIFENNILTKSNLGEEKAVLLGFLPMFHVFGAGMMTCTMAAACAKIVMLPRFEERLFLKSIETYRCNVAFMVPPLMVFLAKSPMVDEYDLSSLRFNFCGAAPLSKELEMAVKNRLKNPKFEIKQGYGMTETTFGVLFQKDFVKPGSIGDVNFGISAKVIDPDGNALGPRQRGELCFKGGVIMLGYIDDEVANKGIIDEEGWLHTGDVGYYDDDLQFFIVDRIKELIKYKGYQVPPAEIEALLLTHEKINDCGVIGKPDDEAGELPMAFVVRADDTLTEDDVIEFVANNISPAKRLRGGVVFVDKIPKNPSGKILRRELRKLLKKREFKSKL